LTAFFCYVKVDLLVAISAVLWVILLTALFCYVKVDLLVAISAVL